MSEAVDYLGLLLENQSLRRQLEEKERALEKLVSWVAADAPKEAPSCRP
jgi:hypothetical protein